MLDRLKSLPLTIFLTILIWMYAESQVNSTQETTPFTVTDVPVWVSGPPDVLANYDVMLADKTVDVKVTGAASAVDSLRRRVRAGGSNATGISAYLDIAEDDRPTGSFLQRRVRVMLPEGLILAQSPDAVGFRLTQRIPATRATGK